MSTLLFFTCCCALIGLPSPASDEPAKKDQDAIQGSWRLVKQTRDGMDLEEEIVRKITREVKENKYTITVDLEDAPQYVDAEFKLDETKSPKEIDVTINSGSAKGQTIKGIYELDGDTMKICYGQPGSERPKKFDAGAESGFTISVWAKVKK